MFPVSLLPVFDMCPESERFLPFSYSVLARIRWSSFEDSKLFTWVVPAAVPFMPPSEEVSYPT